MLNEFQVAKLKALKEQSEIGGWRNATIFVRAQFESKIGMIEVNPTIENCHTTIIV
jgi:hypothetical protein